LGECSMSMSSQSSPDPAQISATRGDPEHTHMPERARDAALRCDVQGRCFGDTAVNS